MHNQSHCCMTQTWLIFFCTSTSLLSAFFAECVVGLFQPYLECFLLHSLLQLRLRAIRRKLRAIAFCFHKLPVNPCHGDGMSYTFAAIEMACPTLQLTWKWHVLRFHCHGNGMSYTSSTTVFDLKVSSLTSHLTQDHKEKKIIQVVVKLCF